MKNKILKLDNPCNEKWENMKPNERGSYCDLCSKNVIDFTELNQIEISKIMKKSGDKICARLTHSQLNAPLLNLENNFELSFPKSKVAAGIILATSLTLGQTLQAENHNLKTEFVQNSDSVLNSKTEKSNLRTSEPKFKDTTIFKGKVTSKDSIKPLENVKITFVTSQKLLTTYTSKDGTFSIEIPQSLIDSNNVIRVSYYDVKQDDDDYIWYEAKDYILSEEELTDPYLIEANKERFSLGGLVVSYSKKRKPIVLSNGTEIKYRAFSRALRGKKSSCSLENTNYLYFDSKFAIAIYGEKAKDGLYILTEK